MTIASEFQSLFTFLVDTAVKEALQQDVPLAGTALQAVPAALFEALQDDIADALQGVPEDANAIATAIDALDGLTATASAGIVTISIDTSDTVTLPAVGVGLDLGIPRAPTSRRQTAARRSGSAIPSTRTVSSSLAR